MLASWESPSPASPSSGGRCLPEPPRRGTPSPPGVAAVGRWDPFATTPHRAAFNPLATAAATVSPSRMSPPLPDSGLRAPSPPPPAPSQSSSSCRWLRWEVQVRRWLPARLPCVCLVKEEASPPLESFTLSSFLLSPRLPRGFGVSRSLSVSLFSLAPIRLQCRQCSLQIPHCTLILFLCL